MTSHQFAAISPEGVYKTKLNQVWMELPSENNLLYLHLTKKA